MTDLLCVFGKAPVAGRVKTRLIPPLDAEEAAAVAEACLRDVVALATEACDDVVLFHDPEEGATQFFHANFPDIASRPQAGASLGERLQEALTWAVGRGADQIVIVGGDVPTLPLEYLTGAFELLSDSEIVLGPTMDGGYYLVGVRASVWPRASNLFAHIAWSTPSVLAQTVDAAHAAGLDCSLGLYWYDVDVADDLRRASSDAAPGSRLATLLVGVPRIPRKLEGSV